MVDLDYIGFDLHKKTVVYCAKAADGTVRDQGSIPATRGELRRWAERRPRPWRGAMEATLFTGWMYDTLTPYPERLEAAHPPRETGNTTPATDGSGGKAPSIPRATRRDPSAASCRVSPRGLRDGERSPEALMNCFEAGRTNPNSIFGDGFPPRSPRPQMDVW